MDLTKNDIIYFRIHRDDYYKVNNVSFAASYDLTLKFEHINHDYSTYSWADGVQHRSTCKCGDWIYEPHIISKTNLCALLFVFRLYAFWHFYFFVFFLFIPFLFLLAYLLTCL